MLVELLSANNVLRTAAPLKGVFDEAVSELRLQLAALGALVNTCSGIGAITVRATCVFGHTEFSCWVGPSLAQLHSGL